MRPASRIVLDKAMTEAQLFEAVRAHLDAFHWLWFHTFDSRRSASGFPDIVATRRRRFDGVEMGWHHRMLFVELKSEKGKITDEQYTWLQAAKDAGVEVYVWRPSDLSSGTIEETLR